MAAPAVILIGGLEVPLTYFDNDATVLAAICKFPPFAEWAASFGASAEYRVTRVEVLNVFWIGRRINGVKAMVELGSSSGQKMTQTINTMEHKVAAVVLPIVHTAQGHVLVFEQDSIVTPGRPSWVLLPGWVTGREVTLRDAAVLEGIGLRMTPADVAPLSSKTFRDSADGHMEQVRFYCWTITKPPAQNKFPLPYRNGRLVLVPTAEVEECLYGSGPRQSAMKVTDCNTALAYALYKKIQQN